MDPTQADRFGYHQQRAVAAIRRLHRATARVKARAGRSNGSSAMASFGMIIGLLMIWAMASSM